MAEIILYNLDIQVVRSTSIDETYAHEIAQVQTLKMFFNVDIEKPF